MVHFFTFNHNNIEYYFIWDIESGSLFNVSNVAFLCAKNLYGTLSDRESDLFNKTPKDDIKFFSNEFKLLEQDGCLNSKQSVKSFKKNLNYVKALCLHICHDCNLNCDYCFAGGGKYNSPKDYMTFDVGKHAIDFLIENSGNIKNIEVDFFGGEPLMNFDVVKKITDYAKITAKNSNKNIYFTLTTNCLLLNEDKANYLNEEMDNVVLSIDGRKETHNAVRHSLNNKNAFDIILNNAKYFVKIRGNRKYYVRSTFTNKNLDFSNDVEFLRKEGFSQISVEPVVLPKNHKLAIQEKHIEKINNEYDNLANSYIQKREEGNWYNFFHFMIDLEKGPCISKRLTGCGAGVEYLAVSPSGDLYPCHQFVGKEKFKIGNVFDGINKSEIRESFANNTVLIKENCKNCPAKYFCGGGCASNSYNFTGSISNTYDIGCKMLVKRFENSLAISAIEKIASNS
ncbi:MAG TPA: thioether cross-link-forming SCIFF peptide maturase [Clostridiales bacterium]|nr:thioether cross-link-forming SCIFF peptide maturase [Clostridiales bacterium]